MPLKYTLNFVVGMESQTVDIVDGKQDWQVKKRANGAQTAPTNDPWDSSITLTVVVVAVIAAVTFTWIKTSLRETWATADPNVLFLEYDPI